MAQLDTWDDFGLGWSRRLARVPLEDSWHWPEPPAPPLEMGEGMSTSVSAQPPAWIFDILDQIPGDMSRDAKLWLAGAFAGRLSCERARVRRRRLVRDVAAERDLMMASRRASEKKTGE
jgi:hypothetical protein